jgi:cobalamin biosynthesis protein CbiG
MAFTSADLDAIDRAIAMGESLVRIDDKEIRYRSVDDMLRARAAIQEAVNASASPDRVIPRHQLADFSDDSDE